MDEVRSCGVLVFRRDPVLSFLLMRHPTRWDIPKGHVDPDESDLDCALRELREETGIGPDDVELDLTFQFESRYLVRDKRNSGVDSEKTMRVFLGWLRHDVPILISEHIGFEWFPWQPPHRIQSTAIDPLLAAVDQHFACWGPQR